jgi:hypothetical protein
MVELSPSRFRRDRESSSRWLPTHQKRAGLGVWSAGRSTQARTAIKAWKRSTPFDPAALETFATALVGLIRAWSPVLPAGTLVTVPPQGASFPGPYAAVEWSRCVNAFQALPFGGILTRTDIRRWHGVHHSLRQAPFLAALPRPPPVMILVVDDPVTTVATIAKIAGGAPERWRWPSRRPRQRAAPRTGPTGGLQLLDHSGSGR